MFIAMDNNQKRWNCMEEIPAVTEGPFYCLACHSPFCSYKITALSLSSRS